MDVTITQVCLYKILPSQQHKGIAIKRLSWACQRRC